MAVLAVITAEVTPAALAVSAAAKAALRHVQRRPAALALEAPERVPAASGDLALFLAHQRPRAA